MSTRPSSVARIRRSRALVGGATAVALLALMTVGCASVRPITESEVAGNQGKPMEWVDANGKHDTAKFDADSTACYAETRRYSDDNRGSDKYFEYRSCMRLKGWRFVPAGATK